MRHPCVHVKAAACDSLLLLLQRFPLHCHVARVTPLAVAPALVLVHSANAHVLKAALQLLDHLMGHCRSRTVPKFLMFLVFSFARCSVELRKDVVARLREGAVEELLVSLLTMQVSGGGGVALNDRQQQQQQKPPPPQPQQQQQQLRVTKSVKELGDHALRIQRRLYEVTGDSGGAGM